MEWSLFSLFFFWFLGIFEDFEFILSLRELAPKLNLEVDRKPQKYHKDQLRFM